MNFNNRFTLIFFWNNVSYNKLNLLHMYFHHLKGWLNLKHILFATVNFTQFLTTLNVRIKGLTTANPLTYAFTHHLTGNIYTTRTAQKHTLGRPKYLRLCRMSSRAMRVSAMLLVRLAENPLGYDIYVADDDEWYCMLTTSSSGNTSIAKHLVIGTVAKNSAKSV